MSPLLEERALFAARMYHSKQKRKYTNEPYWFHCINVAGIVRSVGGTSEMIAAAYLHDVVEDCEISVQEIISEFGLEVGIYVNGLTDKYTKKDYPKLNRSSRKAFEAFRFRHEPDEVKTIKLADLIDNTSFIVQHDPNFAKVYLKEKEEMLKYLVGGNAELYEKAKSQIV